jgi:hypothetical protein
LQLKKSQSYQPENDASSIFFIQLNQLNKYFFSNMVLENSCPRFSVPGATGHATLIETNCYTQNPGRVAILEDRIGDGYVNLGSPDLAILDKSHFKAGVGAGKRQGIG